MVKDLPIMVLSTPVCQQLFKWKYLYFIWCWNPTLLCRLPVYLLAGSSYPKWSFVFSFCSENQIWFTAKPHANVYTPTKSKCIVNTTGVMEDKTRHDDVFWKRRMREITDKPYYLFVTGVIEILLWLRLWETERDGGGAMERERERENKCPQGDSGLCSVSEQNAWSEWARPLTSMEPHGIKPALITLTYTLQFV